MSLFVLKAEEYEFLKELDVLDIIADTDINYKTSLENATHLR